MTLQHWLNEEIVKTHRTTPKEIQDLFRLIDRCISDASVGAISEDLRFNTAYQAALELAKVALCAKGYRMGMGKGHHYYTVMSLEFTMDNRKRANYLNVCRHTRNKTSYDQAGLTSVEAVEELLEEVKEFRKDVVNWLNQHYSQLILKT